jgi:hypothetical protein
LSQGNLATRYVYEKKDHVAKKKNTADAIQQDHASIGSLSELQTDAIDYAMHFMSNAPRIWSNASIEYQIFYQRLVFPEGLEYDLTTNKFRTPKLSTLYTLASMKKDPLNANESLLVPYITRFLKEE